MAEKLKEVDKGKLSMEEYKEWLEDFDANLERFKYESKIKKLVIFKKKNAVGNENSIVD